YAQEATITSVLPALLKIRVDWDGRRYISFTAVTGFESPRARQFSPIHTCHAKLPRISRTF
ncbi:MAG: hypothetical protein WBE93_14745, partial [Pseudolabrys sp.]